MKRYETGEPAPYGIYLARNKVDIRFVGADGEGLEGRKGGVYSRLPTWLVVLVGPALGGMFVMAFPLLVIASIIGTLGVALVRKLGGNHAYVARAGWQPAAAYFKKDQAEPGTAEQDPALEQLEAEVAVRADAEKQP